MKNIEARLETKDWQAIREELHDKGFVIVPEVLSKNECDDLIEAYNADDTYRKTIIMERYRFGLGEYKYFQYPLPELITALRENVYAKIAPVANLWMQQLNINRKFPSAHETMKKLCREHGQEKPTVLILKYGEGGFNTLHQDLYGEIFFPIQMVFMLDQADEDYTGGEFVITEQIPRAQSKVNVLKPNCGDMVLFTTNFRPVKGSRGYYRVNMKHGVSPLHSGHRHSLGIIFHDGRS
ncbi:2OG-Fe(II) oxygenase [Chryseobacterium indologenes]|uniref:Prolyl 4-hydroxylase subunit alpha n=1 Tax=Chryseobacterium indologenes TaxID=253 RepID=A0A0N1KTD0_CHRID|nr:2OG-Fe(II) oxygenase [Chryseobacterium indologenes]KPE52797.1 prolyl 4-hydroxylase subunit alpha [Chryseobacterium indologenes]